MQEAKADRDQELCGRVNTLLSGLVEGKLRWCCFALLQLSLECSLLLHGLVCNQRKLAADCCGYGARSSRLLLGAQTHCCQPCLCGLPRRACAVWLQHSSRQDTAWVL